MTTLAATPVDPDQLDLLQLVADEQTPLGKLRAADFKNACRTVAEAHHGWVHPSRVSAVLHERFGQINPRWFSGQWAPACGPNGFLDKTTVEKPIDPEHSRGNSNKTVKLRKWRGWVS